MCRDVYSDKLLTSQFYCYHVSGERFRELHPFKGQVDFPGGLEEDLYEDKKMD